MRRILAVGATLSVALVGAALPASGDVVPFVERDPAGWDRSQAPQRTLRDGTAAEVGLTQAYLDAAEPALEAGLTREPTPFYPGAVSLIAKEGVVVERSDVGHALRWADADTELPQDEWLPMASDTIFDLASISKLFTAVAVMQLVEDGEVGLEDTAASYIPEFAANGKESITVQQLLTHTAGLPAWINLWSAEDADAALQRVWNVAPTREPGVGYTYSDLGLITLGVIVEEVSGLTLDAYVAANITEPLGLSNTMYNPPADLLPRIAATEYQPAPPRGLVHGEVHDEAAWRLDGVAGHAGLFSTADDVAVFAQMLLNGGVYDGARVLEAATIEQMMQDYTGNVSSAHRGLGPELEAWFYHDVLTSAESAGHTGFTGTSLVIDPHTETIAILMTNRVHPSRTWGNINPVRRAVARAAGLAQPMTGFSQDAAWYSGIGDQLDNTLTVPVTLDDGGELVVDLWYHIETTEDDVLRFEASADGGETWQLLEGTLTADGEVIETPGTVSGDGLGRWWEGRFDLAGLDGDVQLRLTYDTGTNYSGRGVYLDRIQVTSGGTTVFDDWRLPDRVTILTDGWTRVDAAGTEQPAPEEQFRAYYVDAFNLGIQNAGEVSKLVAAAQDVWANALVVQVGRRFDCFCNDSLFPGTQAFIGAPPYDPLQEVIDQAHAAGIEVHAWVNATTLWNLAAAPNDPEHAYNQHGPGAEGRDNWLNVRYDGSYRPPDAPNNTFIDPANPDAVDYVVAGVASIAENYDVDGINLDYIRYPDYNSAATQNDWGYSELSLARFAAETGRTDRPEPDDEEFSQWRRDQISNLVRKIYVGLYEVDPTDRLSINGVTYGFGPASFDDGWAGTQTYEGVLQDWREWYDEGIVDTVTAMNYKRNNEPIAPDQPQMFREWNEALAEYRDDRHGVVGPALYLNEVEDSVEQAQQIVELRLDGWAGYSYANPSLTAYRSGAAAVKDAERADLAAALRSTVFEDDAVVPEMTWKTMPTTGLVSGTVTLPSGEVADQLDVVLVPVEGTEGDPVEATTDGSGWFGVVDLAPGQYRVETVDDTGTAPVVITVVAGEVTQVALLPADELVEVTPEPVTFDDQDGTENDTYTVPDVEGVEYLVDGDVVAAGTYPGTGTVTVTAQAAEGYVLSDDADTEWTYQFDATGPTDPPAEVAPEPVTFDDQDGTENDTYTVPDVEGVEYLVDGDVVAAGTYPGTGTVTVTARAAEGYVLSDDATTVWTYEFDATGRTEPPTEEPTDPPTEEPTDGKDGRDGRDGRDGTDGRDGRDGTDGTDGRDGKHGHGHGHDRHGDGGAAGGTGSGSGLPATGYPVTVPVLAALVLMLAGAAGLRLRRAALSRD